MAGIHLSIPFAHEGIFLHVQNRARNNPGYGSSCIRTDNKTVAWGQGHENTPDSTAVSLLIFYIDINRS
jgi:hypothetical protein